MPGAILSALHVLTHLLLLQPWEGHTVYHSYVPDEETGAVISSDLPHVTQLVSGRAETFTPALHVTGCRESQGLSHHGLSGSTHRPAGKVLHTPYWPDVQCSCLLEAGKDEWLSNSCAIPSKSRGAMVVSLADCSRRLLLPYLLSD